MLWKSQFLKQILQRWVDFFNICVGGRERERYSLCCIFLYMCACICIWRPELSFEIIPLELQGLAFYVHSGDMISGPHACVPGTLWTLPTPQA